MYEKKDIVLKILRIGFEFAIDCVPVRLASYRSRHCHFSYNHSFTLENKILILTLS